MHVNNRLYLTRHDVFRHPLFPLVQGFADTENRGHTRFEDHTIFPGNDLVSFTIQGPTLRVADNGVLTIKIVNHGSRDFAGEGSAGFGANILGAPGNCGTRQLFGDIRQIDIGGADDDFDIEKVKADAKRLNPDIEIFPVSAKTGVGMDDWCEWLKKMAASD